MIIRKSIINGLIYIVTNKDKNSYSYRNDNIDKYPDNCEFYRSPLIIYLMNSFVMSANVMADISFSAAL